MIDFTPLKNRDYDETSKRLVEEWENRAIELEEIEQFRIQPVTKRLIEMTKSEIEHITNLLLDKEEMTDAERRAYIKEKKVRQEYLTLFERSGAEGLEEIRKLVEDEL